MPTPKQTKKYALIGLATFLVFLGAGYALISKSSTAPTVAQTQPPLAQAPEVSSEQMPHYLLQHFKGESTNAAQAALVTKVGNGIVSRSFAKDARTKFQFHVLAEPNLINMFALPSGDVYVTTALVNRMKTEGQLASVLSAGVAHALAGDTLQLAPDGKLFYTPSQETAADEGTVKLMSAAGYDPTAYLGMYQVLTTAYQTRADVPYFGTHPSAQWRLDTIKNEIAKLYPKGVPSILSK